MYINKKTESKIENEYKLQAVLAEYNALISEYRDRMKIQNNILQIHVTVLTAIIGVALTQKLTTVFLLIPIESSIFGIWYFDVAITMLEIGAYIRYKIKNKIQTDFNDKCVMGWEAYFNGEKENNSKETKVFNLLSQHTIRHIISLGIVIVSFFGPAVMSILYLQKSKIFEDDIYGPFKILYFVFFVIIIFVVGYYGYRSSKIGPE